MFFICLPPLPAEGPPEAFLITGPKRGIGRFRARAGNGGSLIHLFGQLTRMCFSLPHSHDV